MSSNSNLLVFGFLFISLASFASAQDVKYEKYKLDNGMTVILHEDHSLPVAAVNIWYRVGSKDEPERRSGFAHLFEHLMFMGTQRVPGGMFDTIMETGGGSNNASTSSDRTNYYSSGPASLLPTLLWLDADRLEDLGRMMDLDKLNKQRDVVRNERRQSYENQPYGKSELAIEGMMYPKGHPYHIPVIGTHEDLEAAQVTDVKDFFATYYVPNNASLVVAGDFKPEEIKPLIAQLFGSLSRGCEPVHHSAEPVKLSGVQRATMLDKVQLPRVAMAYHSPASFADGDGEMDLVAAVLSEGKTSRLYKRLVYEDKIAVDVSAYQASSQLGSLFRVNVSAKPDGDLDRIEKTVDEELNKFIKEGPTKEELERCKVSIELGALLQLQSVEAKADRLNEFEYFFGEPNSFKRNLDRYRQATAESVRSWAQKVLNPNARVVMRVLPEAPKKIDSHRDKQPEISAMGAFKPQAPETFTLSNGIPVMLWRKPELPLVATSMTFTTGGPLGTLNKLGSVTLMAQMMQEGAGNLGALEFSDAMKSLGANFNSSGGRETITLSLTGLKRNFDKATALMADAARRPRMEAKEWERVKKLHIDRLRQQDDQPNVVAGRVGQRLLFGSDSLFGWPASGTTDSVEGLNLEDIKAEHANLIQPGLSKIFIAGDLSQSEAKSLLEKSFGDWKGTSSKPAKSPEVKIAAQNKLRVAIVNRPEAVQTVVYFITPGPRFTDSKRVSYQLLNTLFGGSFTSRLNQNLREKNGYTYGAGSRFAMQQNTGFFSASSSVRADVTGKSVGEFMSEFEKLRKGDVSAEEAGKARESLRTDFIQTFAGLNGIISQAAQLAAANLPFETVEQDMAMMQKVSAEDLNQLAGSAFPLESGVLVLVGDKAAILTQLEGLGLPPAEEFTVRGEEIKR